MNHTYGVWDGYETRNQVFMKSHTNADVMQINYSWLHTYSPDGTGYYNLNYLTDVLDLSRYTEADLALGTVYGHLNAIPIAYNMSVFFYNKDVYDRYGLDIPETWDDLFQAAEQMSKDGIYPIGMVKKHLFLGLVAHFEQTTGRVLFTADGSYCGTAEDWVEILDFYKQLREKKVIPRVEDFGATDFENGTTAGAGCWASDATRYCTELSKSGVNVVIGNNIMEPGADAHRLAAHRELQRKLLGVGVGGHDGGGGVMAACLIGSQLGGSLGDAPGKRLDAHLLPDDAGGGGQHILGADAECLGHKAAGIPRKLQAVRRAGVGVAAVHNDGLRVAVR